MIYELNLKSPTLLYRTYNEHTQDLLPKTASQLSELDYELKVYIGSNLCHNLGV